MEVDLDKTSKKIVEATIKLLEKEGVTGTTTIKIAKSAGVSEVTIFRKFKNKENLLKTTKQYYLNYFLEEIDNVFRYDENKKISELLKDIWWNILDFLDNNINIIQISVEDRRNTEDTRIVTEISDKIINNLTEIFQKSIEKGEIRDINPTVAALNVYSMIFQSLLLWKFFGKEPVEDLNTYLNDFLNIFLNGITANGGN